MEAAGYGALNMNPELSIVIAAYNVANYLPKLLAALDSQSSDWPIEVILVDDGSSDETADVFAKWRPTSLNLEKILITLHQNKGQGAARNQGIEVSRGPWITFPDADDYISSNYLHSNELFLREQADSNVVAVANYLVHYQEWTRKVLDNHPRRSLFKHDEILSIQVNPYLQNYFANSAAMFFRRELIEKTGLRFNTKLKPNFEDGDFSARYFLNNPGIVAFNGRTRYFYRSRRNQTSSVQNMWLDPRKYDLIPNAYLDLLKYSLEYYEEVPAWVQALILSELTPYSNNIRRIPHLNDSSGNSLQDTFRSRIEEISKYLHVDVLHSYRLGALSWKARSFLESQKYSSKNDSWNSKFVAEVRTDHHSQSIEYELHFSGDPPDLRVNGVEILSSPLVLWSKVVTYQVFPGCFLNTLRISIPNDIAASFQVGTDNIEFLYSLNIF